MHEDGALCKYDSISGAPPIRDGIILDVAAGTIPYEAQASVLVNIYKFRTGCCDQDKLGVLSKQRVNSSI